MHIPNKILSTMLYIAPVNNIHYEQPTYPTKAYKVTMYIYTKQIL